MSTTVYHFGKDSIAVTWMGLSPARQIRPSAAPAPPAACQSGDAAPAADMPSLGGDLWPAPAVIVEHVEAAYEFAPGWLVSKQRRDPLTIEAKTVAIHLLARRGLGPTATGRLLNLDHSTVLHHAAKDLAPEAREMVITIERDLHAMAAMPCTGAALAPPPRCTGQTRTQTGRPGVMPRKAGPGAGATAVSGNLWPAPEAIIAHVGRAYRTPRTGPVAEGERARLIRQERQVTVHLLARGGYGLAAIGALLGLEPGAVRGDLNRGPIARQVRAAVETLEAQLHQEAAAPTAPPPWPAGFPGTWLTQAMPA